MDARIVIEVKQPVKDLIYAKAKDQRVTVKDLLLGAVKGAVQLEKSL